MKFILPVIAVLFLFGCRNGVSVPEPAMKKKEYSKIKLENRLLAVTFLPESMGRISSIICKATGEELLSPYSATILDGNPLFTPTTDNGRGFREMFWKMPMSSTPHAMNIINRDRAEITFQANHYMNTHLSVSRRIRLIPDSSIIEFESTIGNQGEVPQFYSLWLNFVPGNEFIPWIPVRDKRKVLIFTDPVNGGNILPWGASWCGAKKGNIVWLLHISPKDMHPDGFFYSWQGPVNGENIRTFEVIQGKRLVAPGKNNLHKFRLMVFTGLTQLQAVYCNWGIGGRLENGTMVLEVAAAANSPQIDAEVYLVGPEDEKAKVGSIMIPPLRTGENRRYTLVLSPQSQFRNHRIEVVIDGTRLELPQDYRKY